MNLAEKILREQGKRVCDRCDGVNHARTEALWFRPYAVQWLCLNCDTEPRVYGSDISGRCNDDTPEPIIAYIGNEPVENRTPTEGNDQG